MILLDENQLKLFDYIPRPTVPYSIFSSDKENAETLLKKLENEPLFKPILMEEKT